MEVLVPENIGDIKLCNFQEYTAIKEPTNKDKLRIFLGLDSELITKKTFDNLIAKIDKALNLDAPFVNRFTINDIEFGFVPNLDKITLSEYTDIEENNYKDIDKLHRLMAVLYRPITKSDSFDNYLIEDYDGTEKYADVMKQMPLNIVNGVLFFFLNLSSELEMTIQRYTMEEHLKELTV